MTSSKNQSLLARLRFARAGLTHAVATENSLKFQVSAFAVALIVLAVLRPEPIWWGLVLMASGAVIAAELFNTALELLADHLHPEMHPSIRIVKDCAAGAVLVAALTAVAVAIALAIHVYLSRQ